MQTAEIYRHIRRLLSRLERLQNPDGSWGDNNFVTALVACSLAEIKNAKIRGSPGALGDILCRKTSAYILSQKSEGWSWNYCRKEKSMGKNASGSFPPRYPDDLDDTFCSLIALFKLKRQILDERAFTHIAQLLMNNELHEGGPYNTWIAGHSEKPKKGRRGGGNGRGARGGRDDHWHDIDPAVNANIHYFLSLANISLPRLTAYIDRVVRRGKFDSKYYHNPLVAIYFISRGYAGNEKESLKKKIWEILRTPANDRPMSMALALCALLNLGESAKKVIPYIKSCLSMIARPGRHLTDEAIYIERMHTEKESGKLQTHYARSEAFCLALCAEMLIAYAERIKSERNEKTKRLTALEENTIYDAVRQRTGIILRALPADMRKAGHHLLSKTLLRDTRRTITLLPARIASALKKSKNRSDPETIISCGVMSLCGWIAYTIYDGVLDGTSDGMSNKNIHQKNDFPGILHIPLANFFQRHMTLIAADMTGTAGMRGDKDFRIIFHRLMNRMDSAEYIESRKFILDIGASGKIHTDIPFPPRHLLYDKSAGFMFPSLCIFMKAGHPVRSPETAQLSEFFRQYISARQLADDIRDWHEDISRGIVTEVTAPILTLWKTTGGAASASIAANEDILREIFIKNVLVPSAQKVLRHARMAKRALASPSMRKHFSDTTFLRDLVTPHEEAAEKILRARPEP